MRHKAPVPHLYNGAGFTLIEVLIVVLILGILTTIAIPVFQGTAVKAKFSRMIMDINQMEKVSRLYLAEHGSIQPWLGQTNSPNEFEPFSGYDVPQNKVPFYYGINTQGHVGPGYDTQLYIWIYTKQEPYPDGDIHTLGSVEFVIYEGNIVDKKWWLYGSHIWAGALYNFLKTLDETVTVG